MDDLYRWRATHGFWAHLFKAAAFQHHRELTPLLAPHIPADAVVLDVGAHAGQYAKLFSRMAPRGTVLACEPGSYARLLLRAALALNRRRNIVVLPLALSDAPGVAPLSVPLKRSGAVGFGLSHLGAVSDLGERFAVAREPAAVARLDDLAEVLRLTRLDFIKIDVEGYELRALRGGAETIARHRPAILAELVAAHLARAGDSLADAFAYLRGLGYTPHWIAGSRATPIDAPADGDVLWLAEDRSSA